MSRGRILDGTVAGGLELPSFETGGPAASGGSPENLSPEARREEAARRGWDEGFDAGKRAGLDSAERETASMLAATRAALRAIVEERRRALGELEPLAFDLAVAVARRIVMDELGARPELVARIVKEAVRRIEKPGPVTVRIHPDLHDALGRLAPGLLDPSPEMVFEVDPTVPVLGPLVVGPTQEVVTDPEVLIRNVVDEIRSAVAAG